MKKRLTFLFLFLFLLVILTACARQKAAEQAGQEAAVSTPIDEDIKNIDIQNSDLNDTALDGFDEDLNTIESV